MMAKELILGYIKAMPWIVGDMFKKKSKVEQFNTYARIDIISGKTGSGKTLASLAHVQALKKRFGATLISNITSPLVDEVLDSEVLRGYAERLEIVVIDEANTTFPAKLKSEVDDELRHFLTQTRKGKGRYIILLTQDYSMLDTNYRKLARYVYDVKTYSGRLTLFRRFRQEDYETYSNAGGINTFARGNRNIKRFSKAIIQTNKLRSLYDYKEKVNTEWFKKKKKADGTNVKPA